MLFWMPTDLKPKRAGLKPIVLLSKRARNGLLEGQDVKLLDAFLHTLYGYTRVKRHKVAASRSTATRNP